MRRVVLEYPDLIFNIMQRTFSMRLDEDDHWEKRLLAGRVQSEDLLTLLMEGVGVSTELPYVVRQTAYIWQKVVERVLRQAPFHPELSVWQLVPVRRMGENMSFQAWTEGIG